MPPTTPPDNAATGDLFSVASDVLTTFTWDYEQKHDPLVKLYEKGKRSQWNATTDLDWSVEVEPDFDRWLAERGFGGGGMFDPAKMLQGSPLERLGDEGIFRFGWEFQSWMVSQFMHGEQGALVATARLVETVPQIDAKYYAATQVMDEARHVEAYARYLNDKLKDTYPISAELKALLQDIMTERRWDITYLGMQILVEGLALAAFGMANVMFQDDLIKQITDYVMRDEARHVAFGVLSLQGIYDDMTAAELRDREEFLMEATTLMRDRFLLEQVWERMELPVEECKEFAKQNILMAVFRQVLFSKIVPNLNKLGLLTDRVRPHFEQLGILQFKDAPDSASELDPDLTAA